MNNYDNFIHLRTHKCETQVLTNQMCKKHNKTIKVHNITICIRVTNQ